MNKRTDTYIYIYIYIWAIAKRGGTAWIWGSVTSAVGIVKTNWDRIWRDHKKISTNIQKVFFEKSKKMSIFALKSGPFFVDFRGPSSLLPPWTGWWYHNMSTTCFQKCLFSVICKTRVSYCVSNFFGRGEAKYEPKKTGKWEKRNQTEKREIEVNLLRPCRLCLCRVQW